MNTTTFGILSIVCQLGFALDLENEDSAGMFTMMSPLLDPSARLENPVNLGGGEPYEKPVGYCYIGSDGHVYGCSCTTLEALYIYSRLNFTIFSIACATNCKASGTCPAPPKGSATCLPPFYVCAITCTEDSDCLEGGTCKDLSKYPPGQGHACLFDQ
ncbi:hypothetical protein FOZ60_015887 [Perkinsus olseni]|uniref:Uncharacterized protein n=1 Tax=Perkinsus olseni TaxID=32597 RepID=A0A7J6N4T1_PEROL|nr:hypothetical protein FOZ60_015887 [Perkinsus olseni]